MVLSSQMTATAGLPASRTRAACRSRQPQARPACSPEPGSCRKTQDQPGQSLEVVATDNPQSVATSDIDLNRTLHRRRFGCWCRGIPLGSINKFYRQKAGCFRHQFLKSAPQALTSDREGDAFWLRTLRRSEPPIALPSQLIAPPEPLSAPLECVPFVALSGGRL